MIKINYFFIISLVFVGTNFGGKKKQSAPRKVEYKLKHPESRRLERQLNNILIQFKNLDPLKSNFAEKLSAVEYRRNILRAEHAAHMKHMDELIAQLVLQLAQLDAPILLAERIEKMKSDN